MGWSIWWMQYHPQLNYFLLSSVWKFKFYNWGALSNVDSQENELSVARSELVARKSLAAKWEISNCQDLSSKFNKTAESSTAKSVAIHGTRLKESMRPQWRSIKQVFNKIPIWTIHLHSGIYHQRVVTFCMVYVFFIPFYTVLNVATWESKTRQSFFSSNTRNNLRFTFRQRSHHILTHKWWITPSQLVVVLVPFSKNLWQLNYR